MRQLNPILAFLFCISCCDQMLLAEDLASTLGKKGKELLVEKFEGSEMPTGWKANTGIMKLNEGALRLSELASDKHVGAYRKPLSMQNMVIQIDFQIDGAKSFQLGFDPAPGELKKRGHLYAITITPTVWSIVENNDKDNPDSKATTHAKANHKLEPNKWYTLVLENKAEDVVATIVGQGTLKAKASDFKVKKPGLVLRAGGPDNTGVLIDNVQVNELE